MVSDSVSNDPLAGVDRAALILAVVAGAITTATADGAWGPFSTFIGVLLLLMVLGCHRPVSEGWQIRSFLLRGAFGGAVSFSLLITFAWLIAYGWPGPYRPAVFDPPTASKLVMLGAAVLAAVLAWKEPAIARWLKHPEGDIEAPEELNAVEPARGS